VILAATLTLALAAPQLHFAPDRAVVGVELVLHAERVGAVLAGTEIVAELPDGTKRTLGTTDASGNLNFVPEVPGQHVFRAEADGLLMIAPCHVAPARSRWLVAAVCVPLGLALLWRNLSRRSASSANLSSVSPERDRRAQ